MKRSRDLHSDLISPSQEVTARLTQFCAEIQRALKANDADSMTKFMVTLSGARASNNALSNADADVWAEASLYIKQKAHEGLLVSIAEHDKKYVDLSSLFGRNQLSLECVVNIANFLDVESKLQLAALSKSWHSLSDAHYFWESLDPFPIKSFSNYNSLKAYLNKNKKRLLSCKSLQMPRIPTSFKLFQDIFASMPLLRSISLHNVIGCVSLRHCILQCPNHAAIVQLSIGLSTRLTPTEISYALTCFGKLYCHCCIDICNNKTIDGSKLASILSELLAGL